MCAATYAVPPHKALTACPVYLFERVRLKPQVSSAVYEVKQKKSAKEVTKTPSSTPPLQNKPKVTK